MKILYFPIISPQSIANNDAGDYQADTLFHGLRSVLGESVVGTRPIHRQVWAPVVGSIIYQQLQTGLLFLGLLPGDLRLLTGIVVISVLAIQRRQAHAQRAI